MATEKQLDLIDRNALLDAEYLISEGGAIGYVVDSEAVRRAPTVDAVKVVHARWVNVQNGKGCCSNCHRLDSIDNLATHCRYCGAKMDGGNEDE